MTRRHAAILVVAVALPLAGGSIAWAVDSAGTGAWHGHSYAYGPSMMGYGYTTAKADPVGGIAEAQQRAQSFADRLGLKTDEVLRFERNYYVTLVDKQGKSATEVLVDPATGATSLEYGPAMMWNTKYGMMSGRYGTSMMGAAGMHSMMGGSYGGTGGVAATQPSGAADVSIDRARVLAQRWLDANESGTKVESGGDSFPGYYTFETLADGRIDGMISVNASTGAVWPHWWHGRFVERS